MDQIDGNYEEFDDQPSLESLNQGIYNPLEEGNFHSLEDNCDYEKHFNHEKDMLSLKLWSSFQTAACSVAQLYKDRESGLTYWVPFLNAATNVTSLYKECIESIKKNADINIQLGIKKRNAELLAWAKKKKRYIRRDEIISFIKSEINSNDHSQSTNYHHQHQHTHYPHHREAAWNRHRSLPSLIIESSSSTTLNPDTRISPQNYTFTSSNDSSLNRSLDSQDIAPEEGDLQTFREALAISVAGLRNCQHQNSNGPNDFVNSCTNRRNSCHKTLTPPNLEAASATELSEFISNEYSRHVESRKRANPSTDVTMDSPTHKRTRLI